MRAQTDYIADLVRREDRDRFLTAMFVPADRRDDVLALYAFNIELARIRDNVSETLIGRMKLQWWRDVVAGICAGQGAPLGNPVTQALNQAITRHKLLQELLERMISTREREMDTDDTGFAFASAVELENYAEGTAASLIQLALHILGATDDVSRQAARHVGIGTALTGILRAVLVHAADNRLLLPKESVSSAGLSGVQDLTPKNVGPVSHVVRDLAATAEAHLAKARSLSVPRTAIPALMGATISSRYLTTLRRAQFDLTHTRVLNMRASVLALMWAAWRGKF
jgi:NADH dehydrogenase [ubiquinone] 1 alpha subcomplex assembly factor 6